MARNKLSKKTISQLDSYRGLLHKEMTYMEQLIRETFFENYYSAEDFLANIELRNEISEKLSLIDYEIGVAMFSSEVEINEEVMSLKQACDQRNSLISELDFYNGFKSMLENTDLTKRKPILNYDELTKVIIETEKRLYSLNEKITSSKNSIIVEIDMSSVAF
jgi:hypothetical protein